MPQPVRTTPRPAGPRQGPGPAEYQAPPFCVQVELTEGCNLRCNFCFGISNKKYTPWVVMRDGPQKRLDHVEDGDVLLTMGEGMRLVETTVVGLVHREVEKWLRVKIGTREYDVTHEHPFFTTRGLLPASELRPGDDVVEARAEEVISWKKRGDRNPMKDAAASARRTANTDYAAVGRKTSDRIAARKAAGTYQHSFSKMSADRLAEVRAAISATKVGSLNPNWRGGPPPNLTMVQEGIRSGLLTHCERCSASGYKMPVMTSSLLVHHKDGNHDNDDRENLAVWCHSCHNRHHGRENNFGESIGWAKGLKRSPESVRRATETRRRNKELRAAVKDHNGREVISVRECTGHLVVRNLRCAPYNTFLADRMLVHNCGLNGIRGKSNDFKFLSLGDAGRLAGLLAGAGWKSRLEFAMHGEPTMNPRFVEILAEFRRALPGSHMMMTSNGGGLLRDPTPLIDAALGYLNVLALDWYENVQIVPKILERYSGVHPVRRYPQDRLANPHRRRGPRSHDLVVIQDIRSATTGVHATLNNHAGSGAPANDRADGRRCATPFRELSVGWDLSVAVCCNDWRGEYRCGSLATQSLEDVWQSPAFRAARRYLYRGRREFAPCRGCDAVSYREGLLPDHKGLLTLSEPGPEDEAAVEAALAAGPSTTPVRRPWELPLIPS